MGNIENTKNAMPSVKEISLKTFCNHPPYFVSDFFAAFIVTIYFQLLCNCKQFHDSIIVKRNVFMMNNNGKVEQYQMNQYQSFYPGKIPSQELNIKHKLI